MGMMSTVELDCAALAAQTILESSGETYRAEETALRMCTAFGLEEAQIMAFPTGFVLSAICENIRETRVFSLVFTGFDMDSLIRAMACMAAACFFGMMLRQPRSTLIFTALIGLLGYAVFHLSGSGLLGFFLSGLVVGVLCELTARIAQRTTTLFLISSIIPTVPGLGLYRSMMALSDNNLEAALRIGLQTLAGIIAIALALTIATSLFGCIRPLSWQKPAD